jgi:hypothetical protein
MITSRQAAGDAHRLGLEELAQRRPNPSLRTAVHMAEHLAQEVDGAAQGQPRIWPIAAFSHSC